MHLQTRDRRGSDIRKNLEKKKKQTFVYVALNHNAHDASLAGGKLISDCLCDFRLVAEVFLRVT